MLLMDSSDRECIVTQKLSMTYSEKKDFIFNPLLLISFQICLVGFIYAEYSYEKTNLSPFSNPSRQCPAFPSIAVNSNCQSLAHHFCVSITSNVDTYNQRNKIIFNKIKCRTLFNQNIFRSENRPNVLSGHKQDPGHFYHTGNTRCHNIRE